MYIYPTRQGCTLNEVEVSKMKKKFFMGLFLIGTLVFSSFVSAGWFADLFDEDKSLVGQAYIKEGGSVKEQIKCVFKDTTSTQICSSTKGSCKGEVQKDNTGRTYVSCGVEVIGKQGEQLTWKSSCIPHLDHNRRFCNEDGILKADVVFVPLEDGDRCKALEKMGKKVITIDLNPLSRTSKTATITIVDNITRALPLLIKTIKKYSSLKENQRKIKDFPSSKSKNFEQLKNKLKKYDNKKILRKSLKTISKL